MQDLNPVIPSRAAIFCGHLNNPTHSRQHSFHIRRGWCRDSLIVRAVRVWLSPTFNHKHLQRPVLGTMFRNELSITIPLSSKVTKREKGLQAPRCLGLPSWCHLAQCIPSSDAECLPQRAIGWGGSPSSHLSRWGRGIVRWWRPCRLGGSHPPGVGWRQTRDSSRSESRHGCVWTACTTWVLSFSSRRWLWIPAIDWHHGAREEESHGRCQCLGEASTGAIWKWQTYFPCRGWGEAFATLAVAAEAPTWLSRVLSSRISAG